MIDHLLKEHRGRDANVLRDLVKARLLLAFDEPAHTDRLNPGPTRKSFHRHAQNVSAAYDANASDTPKTEPPRQDPPIAPTAAPHSEGHNALG